jgi:hypothetical protein
MARLNKEQAKRALSNVAPEKSFWVNNGPVLRNIEELSKAIAGMPKETFKHHVNTEKNDFAAWIREVVGDDTLANALKKVKTKQTAIKKLKQRLATLKRIAK